MNCLINLIPIKQGGGQQVATNLVVQVLNNKEVKPIFLVTKGTYTHKFLEDLNVENVYSIKNGLIYRFFFQFYQLKNIVTQHRIEIIYTLFGPGLFFKGIKSITGCAYSNLFFPEIDFWKGYSFLQRLKLKLVDKYRLSSILKSDAIIFENQAIQRRASKLFNYPLSKTKLILPSISEYPIKEITEDFKNKLKNINVNNFNILMLTSWHKNKNINMIPYILKELNNKGVNDACFIITVPIDHPESVKLFNIAKSLNVEDRICFLGSISPHEVPLLIYSIKAIMLLSLLESFSNNIIEAWYFNKPLFISNQEWSKAICKSAAIYVNRDDEKDIANKIINYRKNNYFQYQITINSQKILKNYPNPKEKVDFQIHFLKQLLGA